MKTEEETFYIIRKANQRNQYLTAFTTSPQSGLLDIQFGYVNDSLKIDTLTEAQAVAKALQSKRADLPECTYEVLFGLLDDPKGGHTYAGAVIWSTED